MGRAVEKRADPQVGSKIGAAIRLAGPAGIGDARRLVEVDGKPYLLLNREVHPVDVRKPFQRPPIATGVPPKFRGVESSAHGSRHDTADRRGRPEHVSRVDGDAFCRSLKGGEVAVVGYETKA